MSRGLLFGGADSLNQDLVRQYVVRIPEVIVRIKQAQKVLDENGCHADLLNILNADPIQFKSALNYRGLLSTLIQIGLFDRFKRTQAFPDYFIAQANGEAACRVCAKINTVEDIVTEQLRNTKDREEGKSQIPINELPVLTRGVTNSQFHIFKKNVETGNYQYLNEEKFEIQSVLEYLHDEHQLTQLVVVGPGESISEQLEESFLRERIQVMESIEMDPLLSWFWQDIRRSEIAIA